MTRLICVILCATAIAITTLVHAYGYALVIGIAAGSLLFVLSGLRGGRLGNAREFGRKSHDVSARIGIALAAAGIASASLGHEPPYPLAIRLFYGLCVAGAGAIAVGLAYKALTSQPNN